MSKAVDIADVTNQASFRNLIINGDFRVNQRGAASRTANSNAYNYDRWYYDGTYLYQGVEDKSVANGTYTLSWVDAGSDITAAYIVSTDSSNNNGPDSGLTYTAVSNGGNITVSEGTEYSKHLWIRFGGTLANLSKVQLVYGSVATPFEHRSYGEELALCQRYFQYVLKTCRLDVYRAGNDSAAATLNYATEMRSTPSFTLTRHSTIYGPVNTGAGTSGLEATDSTNVSTGLYIYTTSTGVQVGVNCSVIAESEL